MEHRSNPGFIPFQRDQATQAAHGQVQPQSGNGIIHQHPQGQASSCWNGNPRGQLTGIPNGQVNGVPNGHINGHKPAPLVVSAQAFRNARTTRGQNGQIVYALPNTGPLLQMQGQPLVGQAEDQNSYYVYPLEHPQQHPQHQLQQRFELAQQNLQQGLQQKFYQEFIQQFQLGRQQLQKEHQQFQQQALQQHRQQLEQQSEQETQQEPLQQTQQQLKQNFQNAEGQLYKHLHHKHSQQYQKQLQLAQQEFHQQYYQQYHQPPQIPQSGYPIPEQQHQSLLQELPHGLPNPSVTPAEGELQIQQVPANSPPPLPEAGKMSGAPDQRRHGTYQERVFNRLTSLISPEQEQVYINGPASDDYTSIHWDQVSWNIYNLPDILYVLKPGPEHEISKEYIKKTTEMIWGKYVNDFQVLPKHISSRVEGWRVEAWMRLDRRISCRDIIDRVNPKYRSFIPAEKIYLRQNRFRIMFHIACWGSIQNTAKISEMLKKEGIDPRLNTTRGMTPGLKSLEQGEAGGRVALPEIVCFTDGLSSVEPQPPQYQRHLPQRGRWIPSNPQTAPVHLLRGTGAIDPQILNGPARKKIKIEDPISPEYPDPEECELAYHGGPPARTFTPEAPEETTRTMSIDEYLERNDINYEDYLRQRYEADKNTTHQRSMSGLSADFKVHDPWAMRNPR